MTEIIVLSYAAAIGFVSAGIAGSFYQWVTSEAPQFRVTYETFLAGIASILFCCFAAPFIIMRNAIRGRRLEKRPLGWLAASAAIAVTWSLCTGIILLEIIVALRVA
ncbi:MAG: hypothetical protein KDJ16_02185 [Hyphomicrobiales bacterium]|nr:hypothetical protein [Hyphomicrobiales bacterium]